MGLSYSFVIFYYTLSYYLAYKLQHFYNKEISWELSCNLI